MSRPQCALALPVALISLVLISLPSVSAWAGDGDKPKSVELQVFLGDKPVGKEVYRTSKGTEANFFTTEAQLQDKIAKKQWKSFKQRAALQTSVSGDAQQYDRWIDVTGATQQTKLFNFNGQWRISVVDAAVDGKRPKPKLTDIKASVPLVVFDERLPSLVLVASERMGDKAECDYVRVDDMTVGRVSITTEHLINPKGERFQRVSFKGPKIDVWVLRDHAGNPLSIKGLDGWRAVFTGAKVPAEGSLKVESTPAPAVSPPAAQTPTSAK